MDQCFSLARTMIKKTPPTNSTLKHGWLFKGFLKMWPFFIHSNKCLMVEELWSTRIETKKIKTDPAFKLLKSNFSTYIYGNPQNFQNKKGSRKKGKDAENGCPWSSSNTPTSLTPKYPHILLQIVPPSRHEYFIFFSLLPSPHIIENNQQLVASYGSNFNTDYTYQVQVLPIQSS